MKGRGIMSPIFLPLFVDADDVDPAMTQLPLDVECPADIEAHPSCGQRGFV